MMETATSEGEDGAERYLPMPDIADVGLTSVLDALADPIRLEIVRELAPGGERRCGMLALSVAPSTRSHHLKTLRAAGVIRTRMVGTQRFVALRRRDLDAQFPGLLDAVLAARR